MNREANQLCCTGVEPHGGERANRTFALDFGAQQGLRSAKVRMSRAAARAHRVLRGIRASLRSTDAQERPPLPSREAREGSRAGALKFAGTARGRDV